MKTSLLFILLGLAVLPSRSFAYQPKISKAGYFEAEESPRVVSCLNVGWDFARGGVNYQGPAVYEKRFDFSAQGDRQFLHFEAVMGKSKVFLNGEQLGERFGGFHPFEFEVTGKLKAQGNILRVEAYEQGGMLSDAVSVRFGFREVRLDPAQGLILNGKPLRKLIGANRHQDFVFIGNALSNSLHYRDAVKLREAGITVIRNAHYPQDPAFMDACDETGLFVIVNTPGWQFWNKDPIFGKRVLDDVAAMVRRDRSHASLLFWEPVLNETWYPGEFSQQMCATAKAEAPRGPNLCASVEPPAGATLHARWYDSSAAAHEAEAPITPTP
ncbi:MAG: glycoside hydrolase family 2 TIM barrel-domain containing protein [Candidatus Spyradenecus sp.]